MVSSFRPTSSLTLKRRSPKRRFGRQWMLKDWIKCKDRKVSPVAFTWFVGRSSNKTGFHSHWAFGLHGFSSDRALISLLPKKTDLLVLEVKDFRPVSLIDSLSKLLAKVLVISLALELLMIVGGVPELFRKSLLPAWQLHVGRDEGKEAP